MVGKTDIPRDGNLIAPATLPTPRVGSSASRWLLLPPSLVAYSRGKGPPLLSLAEQQNDPSPLVSLSQFPLSLSLSISEARTGENDGQTVRQTDNFFHVSREKS